MGEGGVVIGGREGNVLVSVTYSSCMQYLFDLAVASHPLHYLQPVICNGLPEIF